MDGKCIECGDHVDTHRQPYLRQITGWEQPRSSGGANQIKGRTVTGQVVHLACWRGDIRQRTMFDG